jgi:hypothetical protein
MQQATLKIELSRPIAFISGAPLAMVRGMCDFQRQSYLLRFMIVPYHESKMHFDAGDNLDDEWFIVWLLWTATQHRPDLTVHVRDSDGNFLLIEVSCAVFDLILILVWLHVVG